jgi:hypothetical protein
MDEKMIKMGSCGTKKRSRSDHVERKKDQEVIMWNEKKIKK